MAYGDSCSHLLGKLEVHALHYPPLVSMASVWGIGRDFFAGIKIMSLQLFDIRWKGQCPFALQQHTEKFWNIFFQTFQAGMLFISGCSSSELQLFVRCRQATKLLQVRLQQWIKKINSEQHSLQEWYVTTLQWKCASNRTSIDKDMLGDSPWHDRTVLILYVPP